MVACEITKLLKIPALYLVGSAVQKNETNQLLSILHPLARLAPIDWIKASAGKVPHELARMFSDADPAFIRAMCAAIFQWEGLEISNARTRVFRLHGRFDVVIPPPPNVDLLLKGGHLISMTHAEECIRFIENQESQRTGESKEKP